MLLKFFIEKFPLVFKKTDTKLSVSVFEFLIIIYFVLFIYEQSNTYKIMYDFILILIISIWFGVAKNFYNRIKKLKYIYNENSDYNNLYKKYNSSLFNWNLSRFFFIIIWIFNIGFVCYTVESLGLIPNSFSSKILFSITLILNGSSYYGCILHACFLAKLSSLKWLFQK